MYWFVAHLCAHTFTSTFSFKQATGKALFLALLLLCLCSSVLLSAPATVSLCRSTARVNVQHCSSCCSACALWHPAVSLAPQHQLLVVLAFQLQFHPCTLRRMHTSVAAPTSAHLRSSAAASRETRCLCAAQQQLVLLLQRRFRSVSI